jgi:hypothetical protein
MYENAEYDSFTSFYYLLGIETKISKTPERTFAQKIYQATRPQLF